MASSAPEVDDEVAMVLRVVAVVAAGGRGGSGGGMAAPLVVALLLQCRHVPGDRHGVIVADGDGDVGLG